MTRKLLLLNVLAVLFYFAVALDLDFASNLQEGLFEATDSQDYLEYSEWIFGLNSSSNPPNGRTYLYPLILGVRHLGGAGAVWLLHFGFWLASLNLTALAVRRLTQHDWLAVIAFVVFATNVSAIAMTLHGLTETTVIFLLSLWTFILAGTRISELRPRDVFLLVGLLSLLTAVKPVYQVPLFLLLGALMIVIWHQKLKKVTYLVILFLALLPVFVQVGIRLNYNSSFSLSDIAQNVFRDYYLVGVYRRVEGVDRETARNAVLRYETPEILAYLLNHLGPAVTVYVSRVSGGVRSRSGFMDSQEHPRLSALTIKMNLLYSYIHVLFLFVFLYSMRFGTLEFLVKCGAIYLLFIIIIATAGLSAYQGDRLIIVTLPLWLTSYLYALSHCLLRTAANRNRELVGDMEKMGSGT